MWNSHYNNSCVKKKVPILLIIALPTGSFVGNSLGAKIDKLIENFENSTYAELEHSKMNVHDSDKFRSKSSSDNNLQRLFVLPKENINRTSKEERKEEIEHDRKNYSRRFSNVKKFNLMHWFKNSFSRNTIKPRNATSDNKTEDLYNDMKRIINHFEELTSNFGSLFKALQTHDGYIIMKLPVKTNKTNAKNPFRRTIQQPKLSKLNDTINQDNKSGILNTRRNLYVPPSNVIRDKLLLYIDESFREILKKVKTLDILKSSLTDYPTFKIGYTVASIDILMVNLDRLKKDLFENKEFWNDTKVLDAFDKLRVSDNVISSFLSSVRMLFDF